MIIGLDLSLTATAMCLHSEKSTEYKLFGTQKNRDISQSIDYTMRLIYIRDEIKKVVENIDCIEYASIEGLSFGSIGRLAELGGLSYFVREIFIERKIPLMIIPPTVIKKYWTNKGNCSKEEMIAETIRRKIDIPFKKKVKGKMILDDNCVDSLAIVRFTRDLIDGKIDEYLEKIEKFEF